MRKCPDCAQENSSEILFCKHCGRCLLAPDPAESQRPTATLIEDLTTPEGIGFHDLAILNKSRVYTLKRKPQMAPSVVGGLILLMNLLAFILMFEIVRYIVSG
jgi:hypothetical protein